MHIFDHKWECWELYGSYLGNRQLHHNNPSGGMRYIFTQLITSHFYFSFLLFGSLGSLLGLSLIIFTTLSYELRNRDVLILGTVALLEPTGWTLEYFRCTISYLLITQD